MKQKFIEAYMKTAETFAELSSARRLHVGAIIVKEDRIISIGYNGMPAGWDNTCEDMIRGEDVDGIIVYTTKSKPEVLHAETNAIAKVSRSTNSSEGASIFITHAPCLECAKIIYQAGIKEVYYQHNYRTMAGIEFLKQCDIDVQQVEGV